jgi:hypothetical protein
MTKKITLKLNLFFVLPIALLILSAGTGCTKHHADNITQSAQSKGKSLEDSLTGVWKLDRIEIPAAIGNVAAFGSASEREKTDETLTKYQEALKGMVVTFNADKSFQSAYNGNSDVGMWKVSPQGEIETTSKVSDKSSIFQRVSITNSTLAVKYISTDGALLMTFLKK